MTTKARENAEKIAERMRACGWDVKIETEQSEIIYYSDGDVMLPARETVSFIATRRWYDGYLSASWWTVTAGRARTTKFLGGHRSPASMGGKVRKINNRRDLMAWVNTLAVDDFTTRVVK